MKRTGLSIRQARGSGLQGHVGADDGRAGPEALPDNPGEVCVDSAYRGSHFRDAVRAKGGIPRIVATGMWVATNSKRGASARN